ncbi:CRISPR-associated protein Csx3 [Ktedonosporobacter rubrisoli]|nr:CRISPR-associated protein Csx3 [Ktedonosporobacter rubrisoli]
MLNLLPAIVVGGPAHAGKSVLFYSLTHALHARGIRHHAIRACPDGEGNWSQENDPETVNKIRRPLRGEWPESFVQRICQDLEHRCLPFLVDMGGEPRASQYCIFQHCTHAVLLLRDDKPAATKQWESIVADCDLLPLARLQSKLEGTSVLTSQTPIIEGNITGLIRGQNARAQGPVFEALIDSIANLFQSYSPHELEVMFIRQAPAEPLNLFDIAPDGHLQTVMLPSLLASLPENAPLAVYGKGPNWAYAALAAHANPAPFYQFDPRLPFGWIQPLPVYLSGRKTPEVQIENHQTSDVTVLSINIPEKHLDYFQPNPLPFPSVPTETGLIIDGVIPYWLLTSLVRCYKQAGVAWIAPFYAPMTAGVVVHSRVEAYHPGDLVRKPSI